MARILIWGAGTDGHRLYNLLHFDHTILAFVDINPEIWGDSVHDVLIIAPKDIVHFHFDQIIVANKHFEDISKMLYYEYGISLDFILDFSSNPVDKLFFESQMDLRIELLSSIAHQAQVRKLGGAVAELGVFKGDFAYYINRAFTNRPFYLFDTFSGFDQRDIAFEISNSFSNSREKDYYNDDMALVLSRMKYPDNCIVKQGYFPDSLNGLDDTFCFVSLDTDLYAPICSGLEYFYPRLVSGGAILIHDYNNPMFPGAKKAVDVFCQSQSIPYVPVEFCGSALVLK